MLKEIECRVTGKVQMVLFRDFVQKKARALELVGFVENMDDGSVQIVAQGIKERLEKLVEYLHKGPFLARVARIDVEWRDSQEQFSDFKILY